MEVTVAVMVAVRVAVRVAMLCPRRLKRCNQGTGQCDGPRADEMAGAEPRESATAGGEGGISGGGSMSQQ